MTPEEIKKKIQQARAQGIPDESTFKYLNDKGLIPKEKIVQSQVPVQEKPVGGFQSLVQSVAKLPLKALSTVSTAGAQVVATGAKLLGSDNADVLQSRINDAAKGGIDYGYLGRVSGFGQTGSISGDIKEATGAGLEGASYLIGGGGAASTLATGIKGKVLSGIGKGIVTGSTGGATMSLGQALQDAEAKPSDVAMRTLFGGTLGAATGGALGAIAPVVVKGLNTTKRFTNVEQINTELQNLNTRVFKPTAKQTEKWSIQGKDPIKTYTEIFGTDIPAVGKDNRFTRESINDAVQRVDDIYKPAAEGFNTVLRNSPEVNSISKARDMAIKNLDAYNLTPEMKVKAIQRIEDNFNAIGNEAKKTGKLLGDDSIPVAYSDNLKDRFWAATKNFGTEDASISNAVNSSIGHGFKDSIENVIQDINVKGYNKQLGDLIVLRDFLETKAGALAGTGGRMTRLMSRVAGAVVGGQGGPLGSFVGTLTGDKLAQILINPAYQPYRWLINKKLQKLPQAEITKLSQEANNVIEQMLKNRMNRLALPEGSKIGTSNNPFIMPAATVDTSMKIVPAEKTLPTVNPKTGRMQTTYTSQPQRVSATTEPKTKPTTIENKTNVMPSNVPQKAKKAIPNQQGGFIKISSFAKERLHEEDIKFLSEIYDNIGKKQLTKQTEKILADMAKKFDFDPNATTETVKKNISSIIRGEKDIPRSLDKRFNTKAYVGSIARNPLFIGAVGSAGVVALSKSLNKK